MKIVVVGAGIIGASVAYHLAKGGGDVTIIEKSVPASGATSKSFAWINAHYAGTPEFYRLRTTSMEAYRTLEQELGDDDFKVHWSGSLSWELAGAERAQQVAKLEDYGSTPRIIDMAEFKVFEPALRVPDIETCLRMEVEAAIDPVAATHALLQAAVGAGAKLIYGCEVEDFMTAEGRIVGVKTSTGLLYADQVVVTVGVQTQRLLAKAKAHLPMNNSYGLIVHTKPVVPVLSHIIISSDIHFRQQPDGTFLAGESFSGGEVGDDAFEIADRIMVRLKHHLPGVENLEIDFVAFGKRPIPQDGLPAVGAVSDKKGLYVACMHSGITLAPLIGKLAAAEILHGQEADLLSPYRPQRFL